MAELPPAPSVERRPQLRTFHGDSFRDDYEWLREKDSPAVIAQLEAENAYTQARTAGLASLREQLFAEVKTRTKETDLSVPRRRGDWWYFSRTFEGKQYPIHARAPITDADDWTPPTLGDAPVDGEEVLFDENAEAAGHEFFSLGSFDVSRDGTHLLWGVDVSGDERYTVRVRNLVDGVTYTDVIEGTASGAEFTPDGTGLIYQTVDESWRPDTVWLHRIASAQADDVQVFHEPDERFWVGAGFTRSERYLIISMGSNITSEAFLVDADDLTAPPRVVWPKVDGVEYDVDHAVIDGEDVLYILHNGTGADGAPALDFELVRVSAGDPAGERTVVLPHTPGIRRTGIACFRDYAVTEYRSEGLERLAVLDYVTGTQSELRFPEELFTASLSGNPEWAPGLLRIGYGSFITPGTVYDWDPRTGTLYLRKQQPVLGGYDAADYAQRRVWITADDGVQVPVSLVWKQRFGEPGSEVRPLHLYGYGSYEASIDPGFSVMRLSELDRGVIFAVAHVRGGGEMGRAWYESGKKLAKRNTFTDFVAAARHLVEHGYTTPERLVAEGGSAGGLLMGAVANLAPELFAGMLAEVPFVDALTSILDPTLPLTVIEWDEWGDPLHDAEVYRYMQSYSPYENVREGVRYPRILAVTSLNDTRVLYVEPAKWVARLRAVGADAMLKCEMVAGHGGVTGRYNAWRERAFELAWLLDVLGVADVEPQ